MGLVCNERSGAIPYQTKQRQLIMKTFLFHVEFIDDLTGQFRTMAKKYRAKEYQSAKQGFNQYLETNKSIHAVLSCIFIEEI